MYENPLPPLRLDSSSTHKHYFDHSIGKKNYKRCNTTINRISLIFLLSYWLMFAVGGWLSVVGCWFSFGVSHHRRWSIQQNEVRDSIVSLFHHLISWRRYDHLICFSVYYSRQMLIFDALMTEPSLSEPQRSMVEKHRFSSRRWQDADVLRLEKRAKRLEKRAAELFFPEKRARLKQVTSHRT